MAVAVNWRKPSPFLGHKFATRSANLSSGQCMGNSFQPSRISALFWQSRKSREAQEIDSFLGQFSLAGSGSEDTMVKLAQPKTITVSVVSFISEVASSEWDACALDATGTEKFNPFLTHGFLSSLEDSGSAVKATGWMPRHIIAKDEDNKVVGVVPLYLKSHSYGEFVFDHSWADAYYSYGLKYYPKLQCCVPFTPVTGPRILVRNTSYKDQVFDIIVSAMKDLTDKSQLSSLHITYPTENEWHKLGEKGFLQRMGMQYHWKNRNYKRSASFTSFPQLKLTLPTRAKKGRIFRINMSFSKYGTMEGIQLCLPGLQSIKKVTGCVINHFDDFLMDMKQSKRKNIRQERKKISAQNLIMKRLRGYEIKARHWDTFYKFYRNTTDNKWGSPYLTREFFHEMGSRMGDQVLLVVAEEGDELVAGALNLIGGDTLFGRLWGCSPRSYYPSLHFEACYYQAIEAAIELNLQTVEAGAQGEHKIQRGYMPVTTYSCHYLTDHGFRKPIEDFLVREATQVKLVIKLLHDSGPFKEGIPKGESN